MKDASVKMLTLLCNDKKQGRIKKKKKMPQLAVHAIYVEQILYQSFSSMLSPPRRHRHVSEHSQQNLRETLVHFDAPHTVLRRTL